jgi:hypothetical protein
MDIDVGREIYLEMRVGAGHSLLEGSVIGLIIEIFREN